MPGSPHGWPLPTRRVGRQDMPAGYSPPLRPPLTCERWTETMHGDAQQVANWTDRVWRETAARAFSPKIPTVRFATVSSLLMARGVWAHAADPGHIRRSRLHVEQRQREVAAEAPGQTDLPGRAGGAAGQRQEELGARHRMCAPPRMRTSQHPPFHDARFAQVSDDVVEGGQRWVSG